MVLAMRGTVNWRVRVEWSDDDFDLRVDALLLFGIGANNGEGPNAFTVKTHVLGE